MIWHLLLLLSLQTETTFCRITYNHLKIPLHAKPDITINFSNDLITKQQETSNIVIITSTEGAGTLYQLQVKNFDQQTKHPLSISLIDHDTLDDDILIKINTANTRNNVNALFVVIQEGDQSVQYMNAVVTMIRGSGINSKIVIIFNTKVNMNIYREMNIYNIYLFTPAAGGYTQHGVCQFCNQGEDEVKMTNTWTVADGFQHRVKLQNSFKGNFHGKTIKMGTLNGKPKIYVTGKDANGDVTRDGFIYRNYMLLEMMLNIEWKFSHVKSGINQDILVSNGKAVGLMEDLVEGKVDVVGGCWIGRYSRYKHAEFSSSTLYAPAFRIISIEPRKEMKWFGLLRPFKWYMWILILGSALCVAVATYLERKYSNNSSEKASLGDCIFDASTILLWDAMKSQSPPWSTWFMNCMYLFMCFLLVSFYMGEYTAMVIEPDPVYPPIDSFQQLIYKTDLKILTYGMWYKYYLNHFHDVQGIEKRLQDIERVSNEPIWFTILKKLQNNPLKYVFIYSPPMVENFALYFSRLEQKKFHYSKEARPNLYCHLIVSKDFKYKEIFNRKITLMQAMGFVKLNKEKYKGSRMLVAVDKMNRIQGDVGLMKIKQFLGAFLLLLVGKVCALFIFCVEICLKKFKRSCGERQ